MPELLLDSPEVTSYSLLQIVLSRTDVSVCALFKLHNALCADSCAHVSADGDYENVDAFHDPLVELLSRYHFSISLTASCE